MNVIESDNIVFFDCDDTLVMWNTGTPSGSWSSDDETVMFDNYGFSIYLVPHKLHIEQLKKHKARGHKVVVWSAGGWRWAKAIVEGLQLQEYVDLVCSKPQWFYDDITASEFMPEISRIYLDSGVTKPEKIYNDNPFDDDDSVGDTEL